MNAVFFQDLGRISYQAAYTLQKQTQEALIAAQIQGEKTPDTLFFCEHSPVYTLGKSGKTSNQFFSLETLQKEGIEYFVSDRGGDITYHGPGQLVVYFIADLHHFKCDLHWYFRKIEEVLIQTLTDFDLQGKRIEGLTGVWLEHQGAERKIAAMGIHCKKWITVHGAALNIDVDLSAFSRIIPCNIADKGVTSLWQEGKKVSMQDVKQRVKANFAEIFGLEYVKNKK